MSRNNGTTEAKMEKQRKERERQRQYNTVAGLGWKSFGVAFLVVVIAIVIYAAFFR